MQSFHRQSPLREHKGGILPYLVSLKVLSMGPLFEAEGNGSPLPLFLPFFGEDDF